MEYKKSVNKRLTLVELFEKPSELKSQVSQSKKRDVSSKKSVDNYDRNSQKSQVLKGQDFEYDEEELCFYNDIGVLKRSISSPLLIDKKRHITQDSINLVHLLTNVFDRSRYIAVTEQRMNGFYLEKDKT